MTVKRRLRAVAKRGDGATEVYLDGVIARGMGGDVSDASIREQLAVAKGGPICMLVNCDGGVVTEGMAIYNTLRRYSGRKVAIVTGIAASMASVAIMACDEIRVAKGAFIMIHNPLVPMTGGDGDALRKTADELDKVRGELLDIYEARTGLDRSKLEKMMNEETYLTAEEAVELGFADSVEGELDACVPVEMVARLDRSSKKVPEALRALAKGKQKMTIKKGSKKAAEIAALEAQLAQLRAEGGDDDEGDSEEEDEEDEEEKPKDTEEEPHDGEDEEEKSTAQAVLVAMCLELTGAKTATQAQGLLAALVSKGHAAANASRAELVEAAVKAGKLPGALKSWALKATDKAFNGYLKSMGGAKALQLGGKHKAPKTPSGAGGGSQLNDSEAVVARQFRLNPEDATKVFRGDLPATSRQEGSTK